MDVFLKVLWGHKVAFFATFFVVFTFSYVALMALDLLPEPPSEQQSGERMVKETAPMVTVEKESTVVEVVSAPQDSVGQEQEKEVASVNRSAIVPVQISIEKIGKTVPVLNPTSRTIADLDAALLEGVVRHPDSATLSQEGNIFILGHSSYLPNVFNRNFQAFNGIQNLEWGDVINVYSVDRVYEYRVERVYRARAQDVSVPIAGTGNMLTLATCNSFGSVDDRYIVEATQRSVRAI